MKSFIIDDTYSIVCEAKKTRNGFKHVATLLKNGNQHCETKINYLNRTWESFEYESVIEKLLSKSEIPPEKIESFMLKIRKNDNDTDQLKLIKIACTLDHALNKNQKEKNNFMVRMLKTQKNISFPDDWDQLPEDEKSKRLDQVLKTL